MVGEVLTQLALGLAISPMDMMWVSFYSMGFMAVAMLLRYLSRHKISNVILSFIVTTIAFLFLGVGGITMLFVIFYW